MSRFLKLDDGRYLAVDHIAVIYVDPGASGGPRVDLIRKDGAVEAVTSLGGYASTADAQAAAGRLADALGLKAYDPSVVH